MFQISRLKHLCLTLLLFAPLNVLAQGGSSSSVSRAKMTKYYATLGSVDAAARSFSVGVRNSKSYREAWTCQVRAICYRQLLIVIASRTWPMTGQGRAEQEAKKGAAYLKEEQKKKGAFTAPSGLVITVKKEGQGAKPQASSIVKVHYHGTLIDGTVFDSSRTRGEPAEFPLNRVIPCWTDAFTQLKVGSIARLVCPPEIAYGNAGARLFHRERPSYLGSNSDIVKLSHHYRAPSRRRNKAWS